MTDPTDKTAEALRQCIEALALWGSDADADPGEKILSAMSNGITALAAQAHPAPSDAWRDAVLDAAAVHCVDGTEPRQIIARTIASAVAIATDPAVAGPSDAEIAEIWRAAVSAADPPTTVQVVRRLIQQLARYGSQAGALSGLTDTEIAAALEARAKQVSGVGGWDRHHRMWAAARELRGEAGGQERDPWVPVSERLPMLDEPVFVLTGTAISVMARDDNGEDGWFWVQQQWAWNLADPAGMEADDDYQPTHWRPMFALPAADAQPAEGEKA